MPRQLLLMLAITVTVRAGTDSGGPSEDSITLCGVVLHIGAERDAVMHQLASACDLKPADSEGKSWKLYKKENHSVEIGSVMFFSGKVGLATKAWATDGDEMDLADALYFASREFVLEGRHASCFIGADQFDEPGSVPVELRLRAVGRTSSWLPGEQRGFTPGLMCRRISDKRTFATPPPTRDGHKGTPSRNIGLPCVTCIRQRSTEEVDEFWMLELVTRERCTDEAR